MRHQPLPLSVAPGPEVLPLAVRASEGRLVLYLGAGVSAAPPTNGPMGSAVADLLRPLVAEILACDANEIATLTLEGLTARVASEKPSEMPRLKLAASRTFPFADFEPNYGHTAIALLMREGLVGVITANWDCAVERAGRDVGTLITGITSVMSAQQLSQGIPLYKVHGCCTDPSTLMLTKEEVDAPDDWARAQVQVALTSGTVVFTGLGTVGDYVSDPIKETLAVWSGYAAAIRVATPSLPEAWQAVLGTNEDFVHVAGSSDEFLDSLLRAVVVTALDNVRTRAFALSGHDSWALPMRNGIASLRSALDVIPAHTVLRWWGDGLPDSLRGQRFVCDNSGENVALAVALIAGTDGGLEAAGAESRFFVRTPQQYIEIMHRPATHFTEAEAIAQAWSARRAEGGSYEPGLAVTYVVSGLVGTIPRWDSATDIAEESDAETDISRSTWNELRFVAAEDCLQGRYQT